MYLNTKHGIHSQARFRDAMSAKGDPKSGYVGAALERAKRTDRLNYTVNEQNGPKLNFPLPLEAMDTGEKLF